MSSVFLCGPTPKTTEQSSALQKSQLKHVGNGVFECDVSKNPVEITADELATYRRNRVPFNEARAIHVKTGILVGKKLATIRAEWAEMGHGAKTRAVIADWNILKNILKR